VGLREYHHVAALMDLILFIKSFLIDYACVSENTCSFRTFDSIISTSLSIFIFPVTCYFDVKAHFLGIRAYYVYHLCGIVALEKVLSALRWEKY